MNVNVAYHAAEAITRTRARNFYFGIRLLPPAKRRALCAVYALARRIDDIGDGPLEQDCKVSELARAREELDGAGRNVNDPVLVALNDAASRLPIPMEAFEDLIDGVEMDVRGASYESFDDLLVYCRRVAGSIGRLSLGVFESKDMAAAMPLADDLGVALQLTNILRDVREDLEQRRVYLPSEDLTRFDCDLTAANGPTGPVFAALIRFEASRADQWFASSLRLLPLLNWRSAACAGTMAGIYRRLLRRIAQEPSALWRERVRLPAWEKTWVAMGSLARL